jgi:hypothetical protein
MKDLLVIGRIEWKNVEPIAHQISNFMLNLGGSNYQVITLTSFFGKF